MPQDALDGELATVDGDLRRMLSLQRLGRRGDWSGVLFRPFDLPVVGPTVEDRLARLRDLDLPAQCLRVPQCVIQSEDDPPPEQHASILWHLGQFAPLVMVLASGGKSLHGWFRRGTDEDMRAFFRYAARCGADPALWRNHSQFVRMPAGLRNNEKRQHVLCFNADLTSQ